MSSNIARKEWCAQRRRIIYVSKGIVILFILCLVPGTIAMVRPTEGASFGLNHLGHDKDETRTLADTFCCVSICHGFELRLRFSIECPACLQIWPDGVLSGGFRAHTLGSERYRSSAERRSGSCLSLCDSQVGPGRSPCPERICGVDS